MEETVFSGRSKSLKDFLTNDYNKENYKKKYSILQNVLKRVQNQQKSANSKQEEEEISSLIIAFKNGLFLLEKASLFIASQSK